MGFSDYLSQTFPGVRITSGRRDPNSRLGRANPRSWHNKGMAWDTAPIAGMSYDQYVDRVRRDGWDVLEARDEVKNPSAHATGPHWHMAVGGRKEPQVNGLASLFEPPPTYQTPPINGDPRAMEAQGGGLAALLGQGARPPMPELTAQQVNVAAPKPKGRGTANDILGSIFDAMSALGGAKPQYWTGINEQKQLETDGRKRLEEYRRNREDKLSDWLFQQTWQQQNPDKAPMVRDLETWQAMSPEQKAAYAQMQDVRNPIAVSGPQGTYRVPRGYGQQPTNTPQIQPGAVEDGHVYVGGDPANPASWRPQ